MSSIVYFDDLSVGQKWTSSRRTVTESDVVIFAGMTGDFDRAHVDHDYASKSRFKQPLVHGLMGLAWAAGLSTTAPAVRTMALVSVEQWKFLRPVHIGDTVYAVTEVVELASGGRSAGKVTWKKTLFNTQGEEVQSGLFVSLVELAPRVARAKVAAPHLSLEPPAPSVVVDPVASSTGAVGSLAFATEAFATEAVHVVQSTFEMSPPCLIEPPRYTEVLRELEVSSPVETSPVETSPVEKSPLEIRVTTELATETWTIESGDHSTSGEQDFRAQPEELMKESG